MKNRFHGVLSLLLIAAGILVGAVDVLQASISAGIIDMFLVVTGSTVIIYGYCTKCPCNEERCRHILPGKLTRYLPRRTTGSYRISDFLLTGAAIAAMVIYPQFRLIEQPAVLFIFWALVLLGLMEILIFVCKGCANCGCPVHRLRNKPSKSGIA